MHSGLRALLTGPATEVAPLLLGAHITSVLDNARVTVRLTELEAYEGSGDPASHAFRGQTARNRVMFGPPGRLYVYFVYGMHWCANVVCGPPGTATAILLRAGEVVAGLDVARQRQPSRGAAAELARGPARLARCLALTGAANGIDLLDQASAVTLQARPAHTATVGRGPRVGVAAASEAPLRFWLLRDPSVSAYRAARPRPIPKHAADTGTLDVRE